MSIFSTTLLKVNNAEQTRSAGRSLAHSLYHEDLTVLLTGELGAGKTTFAQGFAEGLGVKDRVQSPTYALEQRYERFTHIDLYRLSPEQAAAFLRHSEDVHGIRLIEWAERIGSSVEEPHIHVHIDEGREARNIVCRFEDEAVPDDAQIEAWRDEVRLPTHIRAHTETVAGVVKILADQLTIDRHWLLRHEAMRAAAKVHDLLRFVDFATWNGDASYTPTDDDRTVWTRCKERFGTPHEDAAKRFLIERGYPLLAEIVRTHRGIDDGGAANAMTPEQRILAYADKRVRFDEIVTLDERFDDFVKRYGKGDKESDYAKTWRATMKKIEHSLFPDGPSAL